MFVKPAGIFQLVGMLGSPATSARSLNDPVKTLPKNGHLLLEAKRMVSGTTGNDNQKTQLLSTV
jgi:hypothetical protein